MKYFLFVFTLLFSLINIITAQAPPGRPGSMSAMPGMRQDSLSDPLPKGNARIMGIVADSSTNQVVEFATLALYDISTGKAVDGGLTDDKGKFTLNKIADGEYYLIISFIGYDDKKVSGLKIAKGQDLSLGSITIQQSAALLQEVTITAQQSLIEDKVDRLVYNADKDITSKGGDATDVLRKVPMLSVDLDGNVSLRGSQNVRVLINNKPSTIVAASVADALKQIPADMIKTVEVITSPSAKYDAEGSGGIINIITKKNNMQGLTLNLDSGIGTRGSNLGANGNYRKGKMGVSLSGHGRAFYNKTLTELEQTTLQPGITTLTNQTSDARDVGGFGRFNLGWDYDLTKNQSLAANVSYGTRNFLRQQNLETDIFENNSAILSSARDVDSRDLSGTWDMNLDYVRTFKPRQEWSISTQYSRTDLTNNFNADLLGGLGELTGRQQNNNRNTNREITFQTDYETPVSENQLFEIGAKSIFRTVNSDFEYLVSEGESGGFIPDASRPAGYLDYSQNVAAAYVSYTLTTKNKYSFKVGTRYEYTAIDALTKENGNIEIPAYQNLVPSINISKVLKEGTSLKAGYNRRIQRPGLQQLNPNFNAANPQNISIGNPDLRPELTDNFELSLNTNIKQTYLTIALFGRLTDNAITQVREISDTLVGSIISTYRNIGKQQNYGVNFFGNVYLSKQWTVNGGFDLYYALLDGFTTGSDGTSVAISNEGLAVTGRLMTQLKLGKSWGVQGFGMMRGSPVQLQGRQSSFYMYSLGIKKDFKDKKGSIGLAADNFLSSGTRVNTTLSSPQFIQEEDRHMFNRSIKLTFNYQFGKMNFNDPKPKTRSINNDDVKSGGDNNGN